MKRLALLLALLSSPLYANWCCGTFETGGSALYLRPSSCEFPFAIADTRPFINTATNSAHLPEGRKFGVDPHYEWGFRVMLGYTFDCQGVRVVYNRIHTEDTRKRDLEIWPSFAHPRYMGLINGTGANANTLFAQSPFFSDSTERAHVRSRVDFEYDSIDVQYAFYSHQNGSFSLRPYIGLHLADILHRFRADSQGVLEPGQTDTATAQSSMRFKECSWGLGPLAGIDIDYPIACGFGLSGCAGFAILAGKRDGDICASDTREWMGVDTPPDVDEMIFFHMDERAFLTPYLRASLGISYQFAFCGFSALIELAYEFHSYVNALHDFYFNDERATGISDCHSFDLNGLALSVQIRL